MPDLFPPLRYDRGPAFPASLFERRTRTVLSKVGPGWPEPGRMGLPIPKEYRATAIQGGARAEEFGKVSIERKQAVLPTMQGFVPLIAQKEFAPLRIETIPQGSFGASLKNILTEGAWKAIRTRAYAAAGHVCQVCGSGHSAVECHEVWEYHTPASEETWGVQTLKALLCVCPDCHAMFHPGLANMRGKSAEVAERTRLVNAWSESEYQQFSRWCNALHAFRGKFDWLLDLSELPQLGMLDISETWSIDEERQCLSFRNGKLGVVRTALLGAPWVRGAVGYEALDPASYRAETKRPARKSA